jgi:acyl carrier protein
MSLGKNASQAKDRNSDLATKVRNLVALHLNVESEHVLDGSEFLRDFGIDWLDRLELVIVVEEQFGIEIDDDVIDKIEAVRDLIRVVESHPPH